MNEIWYKLYPSWVPQRIIPVEIKSFTDKTVMLAVDGLAVDRGRRNRITGYECYFPTEKEAKAFAIKNAEIDVERSRIQHAHAVSALDDARKL